MRSRETCDITGTVRIGIITYVVALGETPHQEELYETIKELETVNEEKLMTLADYLKPEIYNRGLEQGVQQGVQQGLEQGLERGIAEGAEKSKTEIAQNMLSMGMDLKIISSATGLSSHEIKGLCS